MHASSATRRLATLTLLAVCALGTYTAQAAEPSRIQKTWSGGPRAAASAPVATPQPRPQPQRNDYENRTTQWQPERSSSYANPSPPAAQVREKPGYQFTQVPPRSLW